MDLQSTIENQSLVVSYLGYVQGACTGLHPPLWDLSFNFHCVPPLVTKQDYGNKGIRYVGTTFLAQQEAIEAMLVGNLDNKTMHVVQVKLVNIVPKDIKIVEHLKGHPQRP